MLWKNITNNRALLLKGARHKYFVAKDYILVESFVKLVIRMSFYSI